MPIEPTPSPFADCPLEVCVGQLRILDHLKDAIVFELRLQRLCHNGCSFGVLMQAVERQHIHCSNARELRIRRDDEVCRRTRP
jgi:hypothetical protein